MRKYLLPFSLVALLGFWAMQSVAQDATNTDATEQTGTAETDNAATTDGAANPDSAASTAVAQEKPAVEEGADAVAEPETTEVTGHAMVKKYFIQGDWKWMSPVLVCFILGLGIAIGRIIVLMFNWINVRKFVSDIEGALKKGDVNRAKDIARNNRGPIASIYYQGLDRANEGIDVVEKSIVSYGSVQMGLLDKGLVWISLFISLAPMLGFLGTVVGMILAFDQIEAMGDIQPSAVAGGIKVALLTTVAGLIVAIILQFFYNLITSIVDSLVNKMEDSSITLVDMMVKYKIAGK